MNVGENSGESQGTSIDEGAVGTLSGHRVAVWTVMFVDGSGKDPALEVQLSIVAPGASESKKIDVKLGDRLQLGADSYRVTDLRRKDAGRPGRIVLAPEKGAP